MFGQILKIVGFIILIMVIAGYIGAVVAGIGWAIGELFRCIYTGPVLIVLAVLLWLIDRGVRYEKRR